MGVGTITHAEDFTASTAAGARFGVSPGLTPALIDAAHASGLPFIPAVMTPSDVIGARAAGFTELELFPAQQAGGIAMLNALAGTFSDVTFCPTGGLTAASAAELSCASECRLRGRVVARPEGRDQGARLATSHDACARGGSPAPAARLSRARILEKATMKKVVLLRHGESTWNAENRFTGWKDVELSQGLDEAKAAGRLLRQEGYEFDVAYTSVLKRAIKTLWQVQEELDRMWIPSIIRGA